VPAAEQRPQQNQLGMAGVLILIEQHDLVTGSLGRADLRVRHGDPGGQRHLIAVVDDFPGRLGRRVGHHQRQQLLAGALTVDDLARERRRAGQLTEAAGQPFSR
jgi:hypothetical protein